MGEFAEGGGEDLDGLALGGEKPWLGGGADAVEVAFAEFLGGRVRIDQASADHDECGVEGDREIGDMQAHGFCLKIENLQRERVAFLGAGAEREGFFLGRDRVVVEFVAGVFRQEVVQILRQAGDARVGLEAAPVAPATAGESGQAEDLERRGHVAGLDAVERVAGEGKSIRACVGGAESRAGREHDDAAFFIATHMSGFGDSAVVAIVAGDDEQFAAGFLRERGGVVGEKIPAREALGEIRRAVEHAVGLIGAGHGEADAGDLRPGELVFGEEFFDAFDPAGDNGVFAELGICGTLREVQGDWRAVFPNTAGFRGRCAAVCAEKDFFHGWNF